MSASHTSALLDVPLTGRTDGTPYRVLAGLVVSLTFAFLINNFLIFAYGWPGALATLGLSDDPAGSAVLGGLQIVSYLAAAAAVLWWVKRHDVDGLAQDAQLYNALAAYIIRAAYWAVLFIGLADMVISFLRVENLLEGVVGKQLTSDLGRPQYRGQHVHIPLMLLSLVVAYFTRTVGFIWLGLLVVMAEFQIVISRFIFSYEQAFMGDLVRFWYAAMFLFASAYTLVHEGHVRVDVLYAGFKQRTKAWTNAIGSVLLGIPLCLVILTLGMWTRGSSLNSPLLSFEISQSGFGMYVKYLMAGFMVVFALSMLVQFAAYFLQSVAVLLGYHDDRRDAN